MSRLAKLVPCGMGSQSLPGQGRAKSQSWGEKQMCPHTSMLGAPTVAPQGTETLAAERRLRDSQDKDIQVDGAARKKL